MYLMCEGPFAPCGRLPFELTVCPCCNHGIKPSRGTTWILPDRLFMNVVEEDCDSPRCFACPLTHLGSMRNPAILLWIGEKFYKTADVFRSEANRMGVSRRVSGMPIDFEIGKTWVYLAHRKTIPYTNDAGDMDFKPGVFMVFQPTNVDLVIDDQNTVPNYPRQLQESLGEDKVRIVEIVQDHAN